MPKTLAGKPAYDLKATTPNLLGNFDTGKLVKSIGDDLADYVGKPMQGLIVKAADAKKLVDKLINSDLPNGKVAQPWLRAGVVGKDMVFLVTDAKSGGKYEEYCVLVKDYVPLREKLKKQTATVVNLDPRDDIINKASQRMADAHGDGTVNTSGSVDYGKIKGSAPIILLAHGDEGRTIRGEIYGKDFAGRTPAQIVAMLTENPDPKKALSKDYAGTVYLDGCFTAQGSGMRNYTKQVWDLLKAKGLTNVSVKGNDGTASTTASGNEVINTTEAERRSEKLEKSAKREIDKIEVAREKALDKLWRAEFGRRDDNAQANLDFDADARVLKIVADADKAVEKVRQILAKELAKIPGYEVTDLVGQFGLPVLNPRR